MEAIWSDFRYAGRAIYKRPGFTAVAVLTLALGIGANTAIFSFVNGVLIRPLPYHDSERLVRVESVQGGETGRISMIDLEELKQIGIFEDIAGYASGAQYNASGDGQPEELPATLCTRNLFDVMGVKLLHGDTWTETYDRERNFGVVITEGLWKRRFGADPGALGQKITLDAAPFYTVFGVVPAAMNFPSNVDLFRSIAINDRMPNYKIRNARNVYGIGRLRQNISHEQARAALASYSSRMAAEYPTDNAAVSFSITPLRDLYFGHASSYLWALLGAVAFVLLIACANLMSLLLARGVSRQREIAVRLALGASRGQVIRQLLAESLLLSLGGGLAGIVLAYWWVDLLGTMIKAELPSWLTIGIDPRVLLFTGMVSAAAGIIAGLAPAIQVSRPDFSDLMKEGSKGSSVGGAQRRLRKALVVSEVALALVLLTGASLMVQSFRALQSTDLGFRREQLLTLRVALPWRKYGGQEGTTKIRLFYQQLLERLTALAGVESAALTSNLPLSDQTDSGKNDFTIEGQSTDQQQLNPYLNDLLVSPNYFRAMGVQLLSGRFLNEQDTETTDRVGVISQRFAELLFSGQDPIGKRFKMGKPDSQTKWTTIVGVVGNVKHEKIDSEGGIDSYVSFLQVPDANAYLLVRAHVDPMSLAREVTTQVQVLDPDQSTFDVEIMEDRVASTIWQQRVSGTLFGIFAVLAIALAAVGVYGVISYSVSQRTREIGIRMALGAEWSRVLKMILGEALILFSAGAFIGLLCALALTRVMRGLLYEVSPFDPLTFAMAPMLLGIVAVAAATIPGLRASRIDPMKALRQE